MSDATSAIDEQLRKHEGDDNSTDASIRNEARGAQIVQTNQLSTPVLIAIMAGMSVCVAVAFMALFIAQQAKTEARVALNHAEEGRITNEVNKALIQAYLPKKEKE